MNFVDFMFDFYSHIISHVTQVFASYTHYTSYLLLNFVQVIVCFWFDQPSLKNSLSFMQNIFDAWESKENGLKILILGELGLIEKRKIIHLQLVQKARPEPTTQVDPRVYPEEEEASMNNSTTP